MGPYHANTPTRDALLTPGRKARPTSGLYLSLEEEQPQQHAIKKQQGPRSWLNALCACALLLACFFVSYSIGTHMHNNSQTPATGAEVPPSQQSQDQPIGSVVEGVSQSGSSAQDDTASSEVEAHALLPQSCMNGRMDGTETGVDCGDPQGLCNPCGTIFSPLNTAPLVRPDHVYDGALEGGPTGTADDVYLSNSYSQLEAESFIPGLFDVPTGRLPSPLGVAEPFTQPLLRFEEFGTQALDFVTGSDAVLRPLPEPRTPTTFPDISSWLANTLKELNQNPLPREYSNTAHSNPFRRVIEAFLGKLLPMAPLEGRPPTANWKHQRWDEFKPKEWVETATTGARSNKGERKHLQRHGYATGEFAPGGLYHRPTGCIGVDVKFHPSLPTQLPESFWTFDGTFPPKLLQARYGEAVNFRHHNALPVDPTVNKGFGIHTMSTHEHNGHNPGESDGFAGAYFFPGQFYDYRWPMVVAGHDSINTDATDPRMGTPDDAFGSRNLPGDWRETMSTHWFHDHMIDFTAQNVYKGNAAMMNYYSKIDRGNEAVNDGVNLRFPSGTELSWGNRDYDMNIVIADKAFDDDGQLWFNPWNLGGFVGDVMTVNMLYKPTLEVRARRYRFRLLDGSVSRNFGVALVIEDPVTGAYIPQPMWMIANDGNIMEHSVLFKDEGLPMQGIAERYDVIIDFSVYAPGTVLYFVNTVEHTDGIKIGQKIPVAQLHLYNSGMGEVLLDPLNALKPELVPPLPPGAPPRRGLRRLGDPCVGKFLQLVVRPYAGTDLSMDPSLYAVGGLKMIPVPRPTQAEIDTAIVHDYNFDKADDPKKPWQIATDGGLELPADTRRISAAPELSATQLQIWTITSGGGWSHPIHSHFEEAVYLDVEGGDRPPDHEFYARKDVFRIGARSYSEMRIAFRFREFSGSYVMHCHNTQHEDHAMLLRWDVNNPGQLLLFPTPIPTWNGVGFFDSHALPNYRGIPINAAPPDDAPVGDAPLAGAPPPPPPPPPGAL